MIAAIDPAAIAALCAALLGAGGLGAVLSYRKAGAEAREIAARTLIEVNEELRRELARRDEEIDRLRARVASLQSKLAALQKEVNELSAEVQRASNGH